MQMVVVANIDIFFVFDKPKNVSFFDNCNYILSTDKHVGIYFLTPLYNKLPPL